MTPEMYKKLPPIEQSKIYCDMIISKKINYTQVGRETGLSTSHISRKVKLMKEHDEDLYNKTVTLIEKLRIELLTENGRRWAKKMRNNHERKN